VDEQPIITKKKKVSKYKVASVVLAILLIISVIYNVRGTGFGGTSAGEIEEKVQAYLSSVPGVTGAEVSEFTKENGVYTGTVTVSGQSFPIYVSADGEFMFPQAIPLGVDTTTPVDTEPVDTTPVDTDPMTKADKPVVELFVMSHCPYGTQAEKGMIPVVELLGDKIDFNIRFVDYAMHGETEVTEQTKQYCIIEEQNDKYLTYLKCFLEAGETDTCLAEAEIDTEMLDTCVAAADEEFSITELLEDQASWSGGRYPQFNVHMDLNNQYNVGGSPTLVVNGDKLESDSRYCDPAGPCVLNPYPGRDSVSYLATICEAFNEAPEECNTELSSASPTPGFGYEAGTDGGAAGSCG